MIRLLLPILGFPIFLMYTACNNEGGRIERSETKKIAVILDTDIGNDVDDTWALLQLLRSPELETKLIVTATGDTVLRAKVTAKFLEVAGRIDIPLGIGVRGEGGVDNQKPWVEGYDLADFPGTIHQDGVQAIIDTIHASSDPVTLLVIGPATNIGEALKRDPSIAPKCRFIGMHGSVDVGYGGSSEISDEYNVRADVPAFQAVLDADWLSCEITPLDTCGDIVLDGDRYQSLFRSEDPALVALFENYKHFAELVKWMKVDYFDTKSSILFDCVAVYMAYTREHLVYKTMNLGVTEKGMTVRDTAGAPVEVAMSWSNQEAFLDHLTARLAGEE